MKIVLILLQRLAQSIGVGLWLCISRAKWLWMRIFRKGLLQGDILFQAAKTKAFPSEIFFVTLGVALPFFTAPRAERHAQVACGAYLTVTIILYWIIKRRLRDSEALARLWANQVLNPERSRVSAGVILSALEHIHIVFVSGGIFLFLVNILFRVQPGLSWMNALYTALMAFNLKGFDDFAPKSDLARAMCALLSIISTLFTGFIGIVFLKPFFIVFKHD